MDADVRAELDRIIENQRALVDGFRAFDDVLATFAQEMDSRHRKVMDHISTVDAKFAALIQEYVDHRHGRPGGA